MQANGFLAVARDIESALERIVDESWPWPHTEERRPKPIVARAGCADASSLTIPLRNGTLALGPLQTIFLCEFDGPRWRTVYVTVL